MAKSPDEIVAEIDRRQNEEDKDLIPRIGRAAAGAAKRMYRAATGANPDTGEKETGFTPRNKFMSAAAGEEIPYETETEAVRSPVDVDRAVRPLNMGKKSTTGKPMKKGGSVSSASKRADGIAQRGKTKGRYL